jgi:RNA polymerase sigma-70 factor (ECF subfamily)
VDLIAGRRLKPACFTRCFKRITDRYKALQSSTMNEETFLENIKNNQGIIFKLVIFYSADEEEKKDLYQEILLQAWKAWPSFRSEAKFSTWLYRVSLNTIFTQKRRKGNIQYKESLEEIAQPVIDKLESNINVESLKHAIRSLAETDRAIISMHLDGFENAEIGTVIGISAKHIAVKLYRIKQQLANYLKINYEP